MIKFFDVPVHPCPICASHNTACTMVIGFPRKWFIECVECHWCGKTKMTVLGAKMSWNKLTEAVKWDG